MLKIIIISFLSVLLLNGSEFKEVQLRINGVTSNSANIGIGNLKIGQSGIIIHKFKNNKTIILSKAYVSSSNTKSSTITFSNEKILEQKSIANTNLKISNGDIFILNFMYDVSLLIVPNFESYKVIMDNYNNYFINSDLFAGYLKINERPVPLKEDFIEFTKNNNIGTIYLVVESKLYILDSNTFSVIKIIDLNKIDNKKFQSPFYTNIQNIKTSTFNFTSKEKIDNYKEYYLNLIKGK